VTPEDPNAGVPNAGVPNAGDPNAGVPNAGDPNAGDPNAEDPNAGDPNAEELVIKAKILKDIGDWKRTFFKIPVRHLTTQEWMDEILLAQAKWDFSRGKPVTFGSLRGAPVSPVSPESAAPKDPLDRVRVAATLLMITALFLIVAVIVFRKTTPNGIYQLVSLASGLAGIGLGWLFGAATARSKKGP
jgi:hypothetical protein